MGSFSIMIKCCVSFKFSIIFICFSWGIVIGFSGVILDFEVINRFEVVLLLFMYCKYIVVL